MWLSASLQNPLAGDMCTCTIVWIDFIAKLQENSVIRNFRITAVF